MLNDLWLNYKKDNLIVLATLSLLFTLQQASMFSKNLGLKMLCKSLFSNHVTMCTRQNSEEETFQIKFSEVSKQFTGSSPGHLISKIPSVIYGS